MGNVDPSLRQPITSRLSVSTGQVLRAQVTGQTSRSPSEVSPGNEHLDVPADHRAGRVVEHLFGGRVAALDQSLLVNRDDGIGGGGDDGAVVLAFAQRVLGAASASAVRRDTRSSRSG